MRNDVQVGEDEGDLIRERNEPHPGGRDPMDDENEPNPAREHVPPPRNPASAPAPVPEADE